MPKLFLYHTPLPTNKPSFSHHHYALSSDSPGVQRRESLLEAPLANFVFPLFPPPPQHLGFFFIGRGQEEPLPQAAKSFQPLKVLFILFSQFFFFIFTITFATLSFSFMLQSLQEVISRIKIFDFGSFPVFLSKDFFHGAAPIFLFQSLKLDPLVRPFLICALGRAEG